MLFVIRNSCRGGGDGEKSVTPVVKMAHSNMSAFSQQAVDGTYIYIDIKSYLQSFKTYVYAFGVKMQTAILL